LPQGNAVRMQQGTRIFAGMGVAMVKWFPNFVRSSAIGTFVGALPGGGADTAAWTAYAVSRRVTKDPESWGKGESLEGIIDATSANNASLAGAWIPALVFAIPGDTITAIAIGVLYMKNVNPGPSIFLENAHILYAVFITFFIANLLMIPLGWMAIRAAVPILRIPRRLLMAPLLMFACLGSYAVENSLFGIGVMLACGLVGYWMEDNAFPVGPCVLGIVMGRLVEENLMTSLIKVQGDITRFFERPVATGLALVTVIIWLWPLFKRQWRPKIGVT